MKLTIKHSYQCHIITVVESRLMLKGVISMSVAVLTHICKGSPFE